MADNDLQRHSKRLKDPYTGKWLDDAWWYETEKGIEVVVERRSLLIPWRSIYGSVGRREK